MADTKFHNGEVQKEYDRWMAVIGPADPYVGKFTIGLHEVFQAHFLLIDFFADTGEGIGGIGPKNMNLLHSALSRQFTEFGGRSKWSDRIQVCASLMYGLIKNHPFYDANKRTAFLTVLLHLQKIGRTPIVTQKEFEDFTVNIAEDSLCHYDGFEEFESLGPDANILFISRYLKKSSRQIDLRVKQITYNELNPIISKRGLYLGNPNGNRIDVIRIDDATQAQSHHRIAKIGFHGWSREVSRRDIDIVREASKLDARHGYDSQSFFNGLDDPLSLIKKYKEPLERLAFR